MRTPARRRKAPGTAAGMRVRVAGPDDATVVTSLRAALRVEESPASPDTSRRRLHAYTRLQLMSLGQAFFLAERGGRTIGLLRCALQFQGEAQPRTALLTTAYVLPAHRRRGVMRQLVDAAAAWSASHGVIDLRLRNARDNTAANAAWEALGFSVVQVVRQRVRVP